MKGKILKSEYNPGYDSWILKETKYGTFSGQATLCKEDADIDNSFDGCRIAEFRADLQAYKAKARKLQDRADGALIAYNNIGQTVPATDPTMEKLYRQYLYLEREATKAYELYYRLKDYEPLNITRLLEQRRRARKSE